MIMEFMDILNLILAILTGLSTAIPLVIQLVKYIKLAIKEKNFGKIMKVALELMAEAEANYATGAERKEYVMDSITTLSNTLDYDVDLDAVSAMIDAIVASSKQINVKK
jgi:hypothetical protein